MSQKKNEGILFPTEIRVVGSYTDRLLNTKIRLIGFELLILVGCPWRIHQTRRIKRIHPEE